ncbi:hypothetical protein LB941_06765 [Ligilactobacillus sp. WILCCON 0076]|uniref:Uncharacterized protein n=1 Tax=Ligilactobacillus ubinensis TaxID=2876789 RepID=A0A9X2FKM5_9LACO|nr:hypothetical protein [Ligilactobacillus ubinensis]MCP0887035.1 hypothetical protein [Ligilactobacillus ubinensis]
MKIKKYSSQKTRAQHTYQFFKDRRNDPAWQEDFFRVKAIRRRNFILKVGLILCILLICVTVYNINQTDTDKTALNNNVKQSSSSIESSIANSNSSSRVNHQVNNQSSSTGQGSIIINDYSRYTNYSGNYDSSDNSYYLDVEKGTLTYNGPEKQQIYYFDKVILHPDDSLVINVHGNYHYNAYDGNGEQSKLMYLSVLLAPANKKIEKNWQTGLNIEDETDFSKNRLAFATSYDNGKTFNMETAYTVFEKGLTTSAEGNSDLELFYSSTD